MTSMDNSRPKVLRQSAREAAKRLFDVGMHPGEFPQRIARALMGAAREGTMLIEALVDRLQSDNLLECLAAALQILVSRRYALLEVDAGAVKAAEQVYLDGLNHSDAEVRQATLMVMCNAPATEAIVERLRQMRKGADPESEVYIAAALWTSEAGDPDSMRVLNKALEGDDIALLRAAGLALARNEVTVAKAVNRMIAVLRGGDERTKLSLLFAFQELGQRAIGAKDTVAEIVMDAPPELQKTAAIVLGSITRGTDAGSAALSMLLNSPDPELKRAALMGLMYAGVFPPDLVRRIGRLLSDRNDGVRESAAMAFCAAGNAAGEALDALIERIELEGSRTVLEYVFDALALIGPRATSSLIGIVRKANRRTHETAAEALATIGLDAAMSLISELEKDANDGVAIALMIVLEHSEFDLSAAIERTASFLEETNDEQKAFMLLMALAEAQTVSERVMAGVIKWVNIGSDELQSSCGRICLRVGEGAIPVLQNALKSATPVGNARIEQIIAALRPQPIEDIRDLAHFQDQTSLRVFFHVGRLLSQGPMRLEALAATLKEQERAGLLLADTPVASRSIQEHLANIKEGFKISVSTKGSRKGLQMNDRAAAFLSRLERYFDSGT